MGSFKSKLSSILLDKVDNLDIIEPVGIMGIQSFHDDGTITEDIDTNLVMNNARKAMALMQANITTGATKSEPINGLRLGIQGHIDPQTPKQPGNGANEYNPSMSQLFSQAQGDYSYFVNFDVKGGIQEEFSEFGKAYLGQNQVGSNESEKCTFKRTLGTGNEDRVIFFEIEIPNGAQNPPQGQSMPYMPYSEAQLYSGNNIFSMKTFPVKYKDSSVKLVITWQIIF